MSITKTYYASLLAKASLVLAVVAVMGMSGKPAMASDFVGTWRPVKIGAMSLPGDTKALLQAHADGTLGGHGGCNRFTGRFTLSGGILSFGPIASTRMACHPVVMQQEQALFVALDQVTHAERHEATLRLLDDEGAEVALFEQVL